MSDTNNSLFSVGDVMRFNTNIDVDISFSALFKSGTYPKVYVLDYVTWCMVNDIFYDKDTNSFSYSLIPLTNAPFMTFRIKENFLEDCIGNLKSPDRSVLEKIWAASGSKKL